MTRGSWDPGPWDPGQGPWDPRPCDYGTLRRVPWHPGLWNWDPETWDPDTQRHVTLTPRILRTGPWELNLWNRFAVSQPTPQIILTLIMKHNFDNKKLWYLSRKLRGSSIWTKHLPKYSEIWHNTKKLENI